MTTQRRSRAREIALQALYQLDLNPEVAPDDLKRFVSGRLHGGPPPGAAWGRSPRAA